MNKPSKDEFLSEWREWGEQVYDNFIELDKQKRIILREFLFRLLSDEKRMPLCEIKKRATQAGWMPNSVSTCLSSDPRFRSNDYGVWWIGV